MQVVGLGDLISISMFSEGRKYPISLGLPNVLNSSINHGITLGTLVGGDGLYLPNFLRNCGSLVLLLVFSLFNSIHHLLEWFHFLSF